MKRLLPFLSNLLLAFSFSVVLIGSFQPYFASRPDVMYDIIAIQMVLILTLAGHSALKLIGRLANKAKLPRNSGNRDSRQPLQPLPRH